MKQLKVNNQMLVPLDNDDKVGEGHFGAVYTYQTDGSKVIKVYKDLDNSNPDVEYQAQLAAWQVGLAPQPYQVTTTDCGLYTVLEMERVYAVQSTFISPKEMRGFIEGFEERLMAFHMSGWSHGDIKRPVGYVSDLIGAEWDNIWITQSGIVLLDYGMAIQQGDDDPFFEFEEQVDKDLIDWGEYSNQLTK